MKRGFDEIDLIMDDMESELNENGVDSEVAQPPIPRPRQSIQVPDEIDSVRSINQITRNILGLPQKVTIPEKPGLKNPSKMTDSLYYDFTNANRGVALIFNHKKFNGQNQDRNGTEKDGDDLKNVLEGLQFDVRSFMDYTLEDIQKVLYDVSTEDHSDNDCLWVTVMSHGNKDGKISSANYEYNVQELWENFLGENCESLIGKPKLFFIQACRGKMVDPGVLLKPKQFSLQLASDTVDASPTEMVFVIPRLADLLVMYSTAEGHYAFRNSQDGSWFIQAICEELKTNPQDDLMRMLTAVNRRVAFAKQSNVPGNANWNAAKQMPNIVSMLTKTLYFTPKSMKLKLENA